MRKLFGVVGLAVVAAVSCTFGTGGPASATVHVPAVAAATASPRIYLSPTSSKVSGGGALSVDAWVDTGTHSINVAELVLSYPTTLLTLTSFDTSTSQLTEGFDPSGAPAGVLDHVAYTPGGSPPVKGDLLIGVLHFTAAKANGTASLCTSDSSVAVDASSNTDIGATVADSDVTVGSGQKTWLGCLHSNLVGQGAVGRTITLHGAGLTKGSTISVSGTGVTASAITVTSAGAAQSALSVSAGAATGYRTVTVKVGSTSVSCPNCLKVETGPSVSSASPDSIVANASTTVTISGSHIGPKATAIVSGTGISVSSTQWVNYTTLKVVLKVASTAPTGARTVTVIDPTVRYSDGGRGSCSNCLSIR